MATSVGLSRRSALINSIWRRALDFIQANEDCPGAAQIVDDCRQGRQRRGRPGMQYHDRAIAMLNYATSHPLGDCVAVLSRLPITHHHVAIDDSRHGELEIAVADGANGTTH